jgi:ATP/maltotriose-dependent transcriptional regulator MalT
LLQALVQKAAANGGALVLLLDDYQKSDDSEGVRDLMGTLLEALPHGVHLVLSSRSTPTIPLARLRLDGQLLELTREDLVLDTEEISAFLAVWSSLQLSPEETELIHQKTGGWIAGLSLLLQSLRSRPKGEIVSFLREFSGSSALVYDYFAEEVLRQQPPDLQRFLMATSILSELDRNSVNSLLEISHGQDILESLAGNNVFIVCLDDRRERYSYHPLFRDFLRARAVRSIGQRGLTELHHRAADVYCGQRDWSRAISHLCSASSFEEAAQIIEKQGEAHLERGYLETVAQWMAALPEQLRNDRPCLVMLEGMIALRQGQYREAIRPLTRAQSLFAEAGDTNRLAAVAASRAMASYRLRNYREAVDLLEFTLAVVTDTSRRALALARLCTFYKELGELERAARFGEGALRTLETLSSSSDEPHPGLETRSLRYLAETYALRGDLDQALALARRAVEISSREHLGPLERGYAICELGRVQAVAGEGDSALEALSDAEGHGARYVEPQRRIVNLWRGNVLVDMGDFNGAEECYQLAGFPPAERAWLYLRQHQPKRAILLASEALSDDALTSEPLKLGSLKSALGLALAASGQDVRALKHLREAESIFEVHGYLHHLTSLRLHIARQLIVAKQTSSGIHTLREAVSVAESRGFLHFYWWDPQLIAWLLAHLMDEETVQNYASRLVAKHPGVHDRAALAPLVAAGGTGEQTMVVHARGRATLAQLLVQVAADCKDPAARARIEGVARADPAAAGCVLRLHSDYGLTWREIEVFVTYYLDRRFDADEGRGRLRKEIATELYMTENTLKSHVKRIRRKLNLPDGADSLEVYRLVVDVEATRGPLS